jgi:hypothetical protein
MPSKNEIASAKVAHLARDGGPYGTVTGPVTVDMETFVGASARWWNARLRITYRFTGRAALN